MDFNEYDGGYRLGTFDKCNGRSPRFVRGDVDIFTDAYFDGYDGNENQLAGPNEWDEAEYFNASDKFEQALEALSPNDEDSEEVWQAWQNILEDTLDRLIENG